MKSHSYAVKKGIAGNYCTMYAATNVHELPLLVTSCDGNL